MSEAKKLDFAIGGQALIEGVMMRSPHYITAAVRKKNGEIKLTEFPYLSVTKKKKMLDWPPLRGVIHLFEMLILGMKALNFSAEEYADDLEPDEHKPGPKPKNRLAEIITFIVSMVISLAGGLFLFKFLPLIITEWLRSQFPAIAAHYLLFNLIDGLLRISIFFGYIGLLSFFKSFRRIFSYHGAEHMAVHTYEKNEALTVENVSKENPEHPRCGTSFILIVFILSIIIYSFVPRHPIFWANLLIRLCVIPFIAGIGFEVLRWSAKHRENFLVRLLVLPGILTQKITTKYPDHKQMEVAIVALEHALKLEKTHGAH